MIRALTFLISFVVPTLYVFAADIATTEVTIPKPDEVKREYSPFVNKSFPQRVFWGDTHLHTTYSPDAGMLNKARCCPNTPSRKVTRSIHEVARDVARDISKTSAYQQSRKDRKKVEVLFAHMKRILKVNRLRLRGITGAKDEFLLTATAQNLRRMAKYLGTGPPGFRVSVVT